MSNGKKWKMTRKQIGKSLRYRSPKIKIGGLTKLAFKHFRHQRWFKDLDTHISMRRAAMREIWGWD